MAAIQIALEPHRMRTLVLCTVLHAFTHVYHVALIPLYLLIRRDFHLANDAHATFLVTAMGVAYFLPAYPMGILADRVSRKKLLAIGLAINALGFIGLAFAPTYWTAVLSLVVAGIGGSFFHPAATALIARLFPDATGKALGQLGIGASIGFFLGPLYAGWRASVHGWHTPVLELGIFGLIGAGIFALLATEHSAPVVADEKAPREKMFATPYVWVFFVGAGLSFCLRDFAGGGMISLGSLFLQRAHGFSPKETGLAIASIYLASIISNPFFGGLSDRGRFRWTTVVLILAACAIFTFPRVPSQWVIPLLALYGFFFMASYPIVEAALMESVHDSVRGRIFGFFITIGGLLGNLAHWSVGSWVKHLGSGSNSPEAYYKLYAVLAGCVLVSISGLAFLNAIRQRQKFVPSVTVPFSLATEEGSR